MNDDRDEPHRATNTVILNQTQQQPPPPSVLGTILAATGGATPQFVAALPQWGDKETVWQVIGCTDSVLFHLLASKQAPDWAGSSARFEDTPRESIDCVVVPFSRVLTAEFEFSGMRGGSFGEERASVTGTWTFQTEEGSAVHVPTDAKTSQARDQLAGLIEKVLTAVR